ncbi:hypothetical protein ACJEJD_24795, partial [Escherichia coli]
MAPSQAQDAGETPARRSRVINVPVQPAAPAQPADLSPAAGASDVPPPAPADDVSAQPEAPDSVEPR